MLSLKLDIKSKELRLMNREARTLAGKIFLSLNLPLKIQIVRLLFMMKMLPQMIPLEVLLYSLMIFLNKEKVKNGLKLVIKEKNAARLTLNSNFIQKMLREQIICNNLISINKWDSISRLYFNLLWCLQWLLCNQCNQCSPWCSQCNLLCSLWECRCSNL